MKRDKPQKPYWEMSLEELQEATKEFDKPIPASKLRPMTKAERAEWRRMRKGPVRSIYVPRPEKGRTPVVLQLDTKLLARSDAYARAHKLTRSQLIEKSLKSVLAFAE